MIGGAPSGEKGNNSVDREHIVRPLRITLERGPIFSILILLHLIRHFTEDFKTEANYGKNTLYTLTRLYFITVLRMPRY